MELTLLQFALMAGFVLATALALLTAALEPPLLRLLAMQAPGPRARVTWWLLAAPLLCGGAYALVTAAGPTLLHDSPAFAAACSGHGESLWHACVWHPGAQDASAWLWAAMALLLMHAGWLAVRALRGLWRARRLLSMLAALDRGDPRSGVHVVDAEQPIALACGLGRGRIVLSRALVECLAEWQLAVVLAHEAAHVAHRDVLWRLLARALSVLHLPRTRRRLLDSLELATEQRCDRIAAGVVGSRVAVAETIVAVERIFRTHATGLEPYGAGFVASFVPERVAALVASRPDARLPLGVSLAVVLFGFCAASTGWLHHVTESLLTFLA